MIGASHTLSAFLATAGWWTYTAIMVGLALHIGGGSVGAIAGYAAVTVKKGERQHRRFGTTFLASMLVMTTAATVLAVVLGERENFAGGILAAYLVLTAWMTVRRPEGVTGLFEKIAALAITVVSGLFLFWGFVAEGMPKHALDGFSAVFYFVFGGIAAVLAVLDFKVIRQGGVSGVQRIARHLWRMCFAFFFATGSFFLGQQKVMPVFMRGSPVLLVLALAPLAFMVFWLIRIRFPTKSPKQTAAA